VAVKFFTKEDLLLPKLKQFRKMDMSAEAKEKVTQLQLIEQNLHTFLTQKQGFQSQLLEIGNALKELESTQGSVYKVVGAVMVASQKDKLESELNERKDVLELRVKSIEKQEKNIKEKAEKLQAEVMQEIEKGTKK
jgi:prefoldin beta subunit